MYSRKKKTRSCYRPLALLLAFLLAAGSCPMSVLEVRASDADLQVEIEVPGEEGGGSSADSSGDLIEGSLPELSRETCSLTLYAGEDGYFPEAADTDPQWITAAVPRGETWQNTLPLLPVPETSTGRSFAGWHCIRLDEDGSVVSETEPDGEEPVQENTILAAVWEDSSGETADRTGDDGSSDGRLYTEGPEEAGTGGISSFAPEEDADRGEADSEDGSAGGPAPEEAAAEGEASEENAFGDPAPAQDGSGEDGPGEDVFEEEASQDPSLVLRMDPETETVSEEAQNDSADGEEDTGEPDAPMTFSVLYDANGGLFENKETTFTETAEAGGQVRIYDCDEPEREGYVFSGWSRNADGGGLLGFRDRYPHNEAESETSGSMTVYAVWTKLHTITLDANGGQFYEKETIRTLAVEDGEVVWYDDLEEPDNTGSMEFRGWSLTGNGTPLSGRTRITGDLTLYALWTELKTVTFDANGGFYGSRKNRRTVYSETFEKEETIDLEDFEPDTDSPEVFKGWSLTRGGALLSGSTYKVQNDTTLYAVWERSLAGSDYAEILLAENSVVYNGKAQTPAVSVYWDGVLLEKNTDYTVTYSSNKSAGKATVTITGKGAYTGTVKKTFQITKAAQKLTLTASASKLAVGKSMTLKAGGAKEKAKYIWKTSNKNTAAVTSAGKVTAKKVGTIKVTVSTAATANYKAASKTLTLKIVPAATTKLTAANQKKGFKLTWKKVTGATGYLLYRDGKKIATISKGTKVTYTDKKADTNGRQYVYKLVAKASTGTSTLSRSVTAYRTVTKAKTKTIKTTDSSGTASAISSTAGSTTGIRYCFEKKYVARTLGSCVKNDLAVIDTDGISKSVISSAKNRGVQIYGYLNAGALEQGRSYYNKYKGLRIAAYEGWSGEYWVDVTSRDWTAHLIEEAQKMKAAGVTGVYLDNTDILYMVQSGFKADKTKMLRTAPTSGEVYKALRDVVNTIETSVGIVVMPNGGDVFVRKFVSENPGVIKTVNQEGVLYEDNKAQSSSDRKYYTSYLDWCKNKGIYIRGIEYTTSAANAQKCIDYYKQHGWQDLYISRHKTLQGD